MNDGFVQQYPMAIPINRKSFWLLSGVGALLAFALAVASAPTDGVWRHLVETVLAELLWNTARLVFGVGVGTILLGVTLAWLTATYHFPGRRWLDWGLMLPLAIPPYVTAFVAIGLLDFSGPVPSALRDQFGVPFPPIRSTGGVIGVMTLSLYPYVYLPVRGAFLSCGARLREVSQSLGRDRGFFWVVLPIARPAVAAGAILVVMETIADFGTVATFNYDTLTTAVYKTWFGFSSLAAAAQLSLLLALAAASIILIESRFRSGARYSTVETAPADRVHLSGARGWLAAGYATGIFSLAVVVPVGQLLAWAAPTLRDEWNGRFLDDVTHSMLIGAIVALCSVGVAFSLISRRRPDPSSDPTGMMLLTKLGYALPGPVLAVGLFTAFAAIDTIPFMPAIGGTLAALVIAQVIRFKAVAQAPISSALASISPRMDESARSLGVSGLSLFRRLHLPLASGGAAAAFALVFLDVMKEMPLTLMMRPFGWETLSVRIFEMTSEGQWERAALPALGLVLAGSPAVILAIRIGAARRSGR